MNKLANNVCIREEKGKLYSRIFGLSANQVVIWVKDSGTASHFTDEKEVITCKNRRPVMNNKKKKLLLYDLSHHLWEGVKAIAFEITFYHISRNSPSQIISRRRLKDFSFQYWQ